MSSFRLILILTFALGASSLLEGCVGVVVGGAVAGAAAGGYSAGQERGLAGEYDDFKTKTNIQVALAAVKPPVDATVDVNVYEGRVLLTGTVPTPAAKDAAADAARRVGGVRALYNEIAVRPPESIWNETKDAWITTELRSKLAFEKDVRSLNYTIETANGAVYLLGSARTEAELGRATATARNIPGVKQVVSFVEIRPGAAVAQQTPPAAGQPPGSPEPAPAATDQGSPSHGSAAPGPVEIHQLSSLR